MTRCSILATRPKGYDTIGAASTLNLHALLIMQPASIPRSLLPEHSL